MPGEKRRWPAKKQWRPVWRVRSQLQWRELLVVHEEVVKDEAMVKTFRVQKERYGDRYLDIGCCQQLKKWTQGDGRSQNKLGAAHREMTYYAIPAQYKGRGPQGTGRDIVAAGDPKGWTLGRRQRMCQECSIGKGSSLKGASASEEGEDI
jgi:hypothetical protein